MKKHVLVQFLFLFLITERTLSQEGYSYTGETNSMLIFVVGNSQIRMLKRQEEEIMCSEYKIEEIS